MTHTAVVVDSESRSTAPRATESQRQRVGFEMRGGDPDDGALQVDEVRDARSSEDRREDDLEHDHHDDRDGPLSEQ